MATKKKSIGAVDRAIKATRAKIAAINKKKREAKQLAKKKSTLSKLQNQLKRTGGSVRTKRRK
jgi:hypothetical protein